MTAGSAGPRVRMLKIMALHPNTAAWCLTHNLPEDQQSLIGPVCSCCKQHLYVSPPAGTCRSFWESQPAAYTLDREPCFVYTLMWDDFRIRTLHPPGTEFDVRSRNVVRECPVTGLDEIDLDPDVFLHPWD